MDKEKLVGRSSLSHSQQQQLPVNRIISHKIKLKKTPNLKKPHSNSSWKLREKRRMEEVPLLSWTPGQEDLSLLFTRNKRRRLRRDHTGWNKAPGPGIQEIQNTFINITEIQIKTASRRDGSKEGREKSRPTGCRQTKERQQAHLKHSVHLKSCRHTNHCQG